MKVIDKNRNRGRDLPKLLLLTLGYKETDFRPHNALLVDTEEYTKIEQSYFAIFSDWRNTKTLNQ